MLHPNKQNKQVKQKHPKTFISSISSLCENHGNKGNKIYEAYICLHMLTSSILNLQQFLFSFFRSFWIISAFWSFNFQWIRKSWISQFHTLDSMEFPYFASISHRFGIKIHQSMPSMPSMRCQRHVRTTRSGAASRSCRCCASTAPRRPRPTPRAAAPAPSKTTRWDTEVSDTEVTQDDTPKFVKFWPFWNKVDNFLGFNDG